MDHEGIEPSRESQQKARTPMQETELLYRTLFNQSPDGIVITDTEGNIIDFNRTAHVQLGYSQDEFCRLHIKDIDVTASQEELLDKIKNVTNRGSDEFDVKHRAKDGQLRDVHVIAQSLNLSGRTVFHSIWRDFTGERLAAAALRRSEEQLQAIFDTTAVGITITNLERKVLRTNPAMAKILGYTREELLGMHVSRVGHPDDDRKNTELYNEMMEGRRTHYQMEKRYFRKDGSVVWGQLTVARNFDEQGNPRFDVAIVEDITSRKNAEQALRESEEKFKSVYEKANDGILVADAGTRKFLEANRMICTMLGYSRDEILGFGIEDIHPRKYIAYVYEQFEKQMRGERTVVEEMPVLRKDGSVFYADICTAFITIGGKQCAVGIFRDITERKQAQEKVRLHEDQLTVQVEKRTSELKRANEQLLREITERQRMEEELVKAQKLESVGILAGGIAHDFNNLLTTIMGSISLAQLELDQQHPAFRELAGAERAASRAEDLTRQLLTFSRGGAPVRKTASIGEIIRESASFALRGSRVRPTLNIPPDLWPVDVDEGQISQVFHNLVINADQAIPEGGAITICCENVVLSGAAGPFPAPGKYVKITVRDTGVGIPKENLPRIFDPYFTTKQGGSGLGLATTYSIIHKHDGSIMVDSQPGTGSTFTILLPASPQSRPGKKPEKKELKTSSAKILIMDDDEDVRHTASHSLQRLGYRVICAEDGVQAIQLYQHAMETGERFDAVIMDLTIPGGMGGKEAIKHLLAINPEVKAIVSSGYSNDPIMAEYRKYGFAGVVIKPYVVRQLSDTVYSVIAESRAEEDGNGNSR